MRRKIKQLISIDKVDVGPPSFSLFVVYKICREIQRTEEEHIFIDYIGDIEIKKIINFLL